VIEDRFPVGRPAWEDVGAQFVTDVAPYEFMKLRLLNASHLAVSGPVSSAATPARSTAVPGGMLTRSCTTAYRPAGSPSSP